MSLVEEILSFNKKFVESGEYEKYVTTKYPNKKIAILSCMDTRLTELLPAALNFRNGDIKIIKNAGGVISHPFGSVMRSLLVAIYELQVEEVLVIGHYDCGMQALRPENMIEKMRLRGVGEGELALIEYCGIDINQWLKGFDSPQESVNETVRVIKTHPLVPKDVLVSGFMMDPCTGRLDVVE